MKIDKELLLKNPEIINEEVSTQEPTEHPTIKTNEIEKELSNIKNIFQDMENIVKKDITKDILTLKKELLDLQFKYQEELIKKTIEHRDNLIDLKNGIGIIYHPEYFKQNAELDLLPLLRKIYDKQYEIEELEHKFALDIKQAME